MYYDEPSFHVPSKFQILYSSCMDFMQSDDSIHHWHGNHGAYDQANHD